MERGIDGAGAEPGTRGGATEAGLADLVRGWLAGRLPADWFAAAPDVVVDREEIVVVGHLPDPRSDGAAEEVAAAAEAGRVKAFREDTRDRRVAIAREMEHRFGRRVAWGADCGSRRELFTTLSVPVMTRLRQRERLVLDTLVDAGVARSRSDALAWCVRLVDRNVDEWLEQLREAMLAVQRVRSAGPHAEG